MIAHKIQIFFFSPPEFTDVTDAVALASHPEEL
jgi:hypothetical protein